jgi:Rod binding domain-containing protein
MTLATFSPELQTASHHQKVTSTGGASETPAHRKLRKVAQEFEGILISQLCDQFQMGFSSLSGETPMAGSETLNSLAVQALSTALASRGGLGIGQMLVRQLEPSLNRSQANQMGEKIKTASRD